jgi:quinol monooxygenase YgiN
MTVLIAGTVTIDADNHDAILEAALEMMAATHLEPGCITYVFTPDARDPGVLHIFEKWDTAADLERHLTTEHLATWRTRSEELGVLDRDLAVYEVASEKRL